MRLLRREPHLLAKLLFSLGSVLGCARNSPHAERMAAALLELLRWSRGSEHAEVRRASLFGCAQVLATVPPAVLRAREEWRHRLQEMGRWAGRVSAEDADGACREQAGLLARMLGASG